ncbi:FtsK/SpoIIIE domain-containing protein [Pseudarthrobacter sp. efr-133-R2A-89]|uniref:FtsK/SpoIIIE domain-containing protein n=1 Tax=Pseudarthrobacter sp. efr-133-R2A-89 TaxID=3040302 RepID=UPI002555412E|nr:FtsK/SpoIIIE domain-containing protein [Pseudarthrobacter sp. efr-133-R2A-89]
MLQHESDGQQVLELNIRFDVNLSSAAGTVSVDRHVTYLADSTVRELIEALQQDPSVVPPEWLEVQSHSRMGLYYQSLSTKTDLGVSVMRGGYLPETGLLMHCGLTDGSCLFFEDRTQPRVDRNASDLVIDEELNDASDSDALYLVDERGTQKGRVVKLPLGRRVTYGALSFDADVIVDDQLLGTSEIGVTSMGSHALVDIPDEVGVVSISGNRVKAGQHKLTPGAIVELTRHGESDPRIILSIRSYEGLAAHPRSGRVKFEPSARQGFPRLEALPERYRRVAKRPQAPEAPKLDFVPVLTSLVMAAGLAVFSGYWAFVLISPLVAIPIWWTWRSASKRQQREHEKATKEWLKTSGDAFEKLTEFAGVEEMKLRIQAPPTEYWTLQAYRRLSGLWVRDHIDPDFLQIRVGDMEPLSRYQIELEPGVDINDREFRQLAGNAHRIITREYVRPNLRDVPALVNLSEQNYGIIGPWSQVRASVTDAILQLVCSHSPGVLALALLGPRSTQTSELIEWMKWLPHIRSGSRLMPATRITRGSEAGNAFLRSLLELLSEEREERTENLRHHAVLVVHESAELDQGLLQDVLEASKGAVHLLWLGTGRPLLSKSVTSWLHIPNDVDASEDAIRASLANSTEGLSQEVFFNRVHTDAFRISSQLAPLYDPRVTGASASIPTKVPLSSLGAVTDVVWTEGSAVEHLVVPLGISEEGVFEFDLVTHGPHTLIGGATGSGKSELLQTLVASLMRHHSPDEVALFLVDFKGGSTFQIFSDLPHVVGHVTDLDGPHVDRALAFLRSEIQRRMHIYRGCGNPANYETYRARISSDATGKAVLPRLVVIFDEFATLVKDADERAKRPVLDLAQRGRSLGIHLVLATQSPSADVVDRSVRANVHASIALQTLSAEESENIIQRPEAAAIPKHLQGRALFRHGTAKILEFQTAYAGAPVAAGVNKRDRTVKLVPLELELEGKFPEPASTAQSPEASTATTEIAELLDRIRKVWSFVERNSVRAVVNLQPPLTQIAHRPTPRPEFDNTAERHSHMRTVPWGLRDRPAQGDQSIFHADFTSGVAVVGGPARSGKTTSLLSLGWNWTVTTRKQVVVVDGGGSLSEEVRRLGLGWHLVACSDSTEITRTIDRFHRVLSRNMQPGTHSEPQVLLLVDGFERLMSLLSASRSAVWFDKFRDLVRYGRDYGIALALSVSSVARIGQEIGPDLGSTISLWENYEKYGTPVDERQPGIGYTTDGDLVQVFFDDLGNQSAPELKNLDRPIVAPEALDISIVLETFECDWSEIVIGTDDIAGAPITVDLLRSPLLVAGHARSGKSSLLRSIAMQLRGGGSGGGRVAILSSSIRSTDPDFVVISEEEINEVRNNVHGVAEEALKLLRARAVISIGGRFAIFVDDVNQRANTASWPSVIQALLDSDRIVLVWAFMPHQRLGPNQIGNFHPTVILQPNPRLEVDEGSSLLSVPLQHRPWTKYEPGQGIFVSGSSQQVIFAAKVPAKSSRFDTAE